MILAEEKERMSRSYIEECSKVKNEVNGWLRITGEMQKKIAAKFGYTNPLYNELAVNMMRKSCELYPNDNKFKLALVSFRENISGKCKYKIGDILPNPTIWSFQQNIKKEKLYDIISNNNSDSNKHTVIIASSAT